MPISRDSGGEIRVKIIIDGDESGHSVNELRKWLRSDDELVGAEVDFVAPDSRPDEMSGGIAEALMATIADPGVLGALIGAVGGWVTARASARRTRIRVKVGEREIEMDGPALRDPEGVARRLRSELGEAP
ncbi:hypothetical protein AB0G04_25160 [Actinoplanes sp. NPDC023801]|uniref:effector-associated constant component EACC1 n=1 Tax=Actinoplanes sp. NPDC023801 TaxID=3154595 RepID=UPI0033E0DF96